MSPWGTSFLADLCPGGTQQIQHFTMTNNNNKKTNGNGNGKNNSKPNARKKKVNAATSALAAPSIPKPLAIASRNRRPNEKLYTDMEGSDFITRITTNPTASTTAESILATIPVSPTAYPGTRLAQLSNLWERYRFTHYKLRYVPAVPMTLACQYLIYIDTDPLDDAFTVLDVDALIRQGTAQARSQQFNFNEPMDITLALRQDDQMYYTGLDKQNIRFSQQAKIYVLQVTDCLDFNGQLIATPVTSGALYFDWKCCFGIPQINPSAIDVVGAPAGGPPFDGSTSANTTYYELTSAELVVPVTPLTRYVVYSSLNAQYSPTVSVQYFTTAAVQGATGSIAQDSGAVRGSISFIAPTSGFVTFTTDTTGSFPVNDFFLALMPID